VQKKYYNPAAEVDVTNVVCGSDTTVLVRSPSDHHWWCSGVITGTSLQVVTANVNQLPDSNAKMSYRMNIDPVQLGKPPFNQLSPINR
jgi:hypothetical protein